MTGILHMLSVFFRSHPLVSATFHNVNNFHLTNLISYLLLSEYLYQLGQAQLCCSNNSNISLWYNNMGLFLLQLYIYISPSGSILALSDVNLTQESKLMEHLVLEIGNEEKHMLPTKASTQGYCMSLLHRIHRLKKDVCVQQGWDV